MIPRRVVFLLHGSRGCYLQMANIERLLLNSSSSSLSTASHNIPIVFNLKGVSLDTHGGIYSCGTRIATDIEAALQSLSVRSGEQLLLSAVGYSMGGIVIREALAQLYESRRLSPDVKFDTFVSICSPHCGTRNFTPTMQQICAKALNLFDRARTYNDMIKPERYFAGPGIRQAQLRVWYEFKKRVLIAVDNDRIVPAQSALMLPVLQSRYSAVETLREFSDSEISPEHRFERNSEALLSELDLLQAFKIKSKCTFLDEEKYPEYMIAKKYMSELFKKESENETIGSVFDLHITLDKYINNCRKSGTLPVIAPKLLSKLLERKAHFAAVAAEPASYFDVFGDISNYTVKNILSS